MTINKILPDILEHKTHFEKVLEETKQLSNQVKNMTPENKRNIYDKTMNLLQNSVAEAERTINAIDNSIAYLEECKKLLEEVISLYDEINIEFNMSRTGPLSARALGKVREYNLPAESAEQQFVLDLPYNEREEIIRHNNTGGRRVNRKTKRRRKRVTKNSKRK
jgi:hypothetical protein